MDTQKKRRRGILFYGNKTSSSSPISPRALLSRWLSRRNSDSDSGRRVVKPDRVATGERNSGGKQEGLSFNLGIGIGLICLLAKSASEVNKMIELRAQMEMLVKEVRAELRTKDAIASSSESNNNILISPIQCYGESKRMTTSMDLCSASYGFQETKHAAESERQSNYATALGNTRSMSIDQMEAELEVELERLQTNLDGESSSAHQHRVELDDEKDDPSFESISVNHEEDDIVPKDTQEYHGVSAHELERRLHELLATRQQEQIEELQSALKCMEKKLLEKEMKLSCCEETNCFVLQNEEET